MTETEFEQCVVEALRERFQAMGLVRAATWGNPERWSRDDLATDLAPRVAAAIDRVWDNMATGGIDLDEARDFALRSLRGESWRGVP